MRTFEEKFNGAIEEWVAPRVVLFIFRKVARFYRFWRKSQVKF